MGGCCEHGDEPSGSGTTGLVTNALVHYQCDQSSEQHEVSITLCKLAAVTSACGVQLNVFG
jgi:hypothetical protein